MHNMCSNSNEYKLTWCKKVLKVNCATAYQNQFTSVSQGRKKGADVRETRFGSNL